MSPCRGVYGNGLRDAGHATRLPSTGAIAARLAPTASTTFQETRSHNLSLLLEESLGADEHGQPNLGTDLSLNHKLLSLVLEAGLDQFVAQHVDPSDDSDENQDQISKCLKLVGLIVEKTPTALLLPSNSERSSLDAGEAPIFAWLIPRLLSVLALETADRHSVEDNVWRLLGKILLPNTRYLDNFDHLLMISAYLQELIGGLLSHLENLEIGEALTKNPLPSFSFRVPSLLATESLRATIKIDEPTRQYSCTVFVGNLLQALKTISRLLHVVITSTVQQSDITIHAVKRGSTRTPEALRRCWELVLYITTVIKRTDRGLPNVFEQYLDSMVHALLHSGGSRIQDLLTSSICSLWADIVADLSSAFQENRSENVGRLMMLIFRKSVDISHRCPEVRAAICDMDLWWADDSEKGANILTDNPNGERAIISEVRDLLAGLRKPPKSENSISLPVYSHDGQHSLNDGEPARKRLRRASNEHFLSEERHAQRLRRKLHGQLGLKDGLVLYELQRTVVSQFRLMSQSDQRAVFDLLGQISCAEHIAAMDSQTNASQLQGSCSLCTGEFESSRPRHEPVNTGYPLMIIFGCMIPSHQASPQTRLHAMSALKSLLTHATWARHLDITKSTAGQWCLNSLRSSTREVRIAAILTLRCFLQSSPRLDQDLLHKNRVRVLEFLQSTYDKDVPFLQETAILAFSDMAILGGEDELNLVLVRFTEFLGHPNPYISGLVYAELQKISRKLKVTAAGLLKPFLRTIAAIVVRNFSSQPIIAQSLCEFLGTGMNVDVLLMLIEEYALPYLIVTKKKEIIQRIVRAYGDSMTVFDLCTKDNNLAAILSYLLSHFGRPNVDSANLILSLLADISPDFGRHDLADWIKLEPILIACELLKSIGDGHAAEDSGPHEGLRQLARLYIRRTLGPSSLRRGNPVILFVENHVLGIIAQFAAVLNEPRAQQPNLEKRRYLGAIGELLKVGENAVSIALPQIAACLRSAMDNRALCDKAFESWAVMMLNLPQEIIAPLIDQTLAAIVQNWDIFRNTTQKAACQLVTEIWEIHRVFMMESLHFMPSLSAVPQLASLEVDIRDSKAKLDRNKRLATFAKRLSSDNVTLVRLTIQELIKTSNEDQEWLHDSALRDQPESAIADLSHSLLDASVQHQADKEVVAASGQALGRIGCLDFSKTEVGREKKSILALFNFTSADETVDWIMFFLEQVLVKAFLSAPNARSQGFLAWSMQELLKVCDLDGKGSHRSRSATASNGNSKYRSWWDLDENIRQALSPFLNSHYSLNIAMIQTECSYPLFGSRPMSHREWLQTLVLDLLSSAPGDNNIQMIFTICIRIIRWQDISIPIFLLPFAALNLFIADTSSHRKRQLHLIDEMLAVLKQPLSGTHESNENVKLCSQRVFDMLDYISNWLQQKRKQIQAIVSRNDRSTGKEGVKLFETQLGQAEQVLEAIPPDLISSRAIECRSYSRALFHWEQHIRKLRETTGESDALLARLQEIYTQIDEPDGIEGISAKMHALTIDQQVLEYQKAGNWKAAQNWYEIQLQEQPDDSVLQLNLLSCLKETGQYNALLNQFLALKTSEPNLRTMPLAIEAAWTIERWDDLNEIIREVPEDTGDFNLAMGTILSALKAGDLVRSCSLLDELRLATTMSLTSNVTSSLQSCHEVLFRLHAIEDLQVILSTTAQNAANVRSKLGGRLELLGVDVSAKRRLLGLQRAAMTLTPHFTNMDVAAGWLATAKLSRKFALSGQALNAVLHATMLGDNSATIEDAKLMWRDGRHRKAIHRLQGAIQSGAFTSHNFESRDMSVTSNQVKQQNVVVAKAQLMLAKWLDSAGQTQADIVRKHYRRVTDSHRRWDKGWYYLGRHYNKILDFEKTKPIGKEAQSYLTGEAYKLVIENYLRASGFGCKYVFQTLPKVLTLWLELVTGTDQLQDARRGNEKFTTHLWKQRKQVVEETNGQVRKYVERLQPVVWYTILSQVVARIDLPQQPVSDILVGMVVKVLRGFPRQAMWTVLALAKSSSKGRAQRGLAILARVVEVSKKFHKDATPKPGRDLSAPEMRELIAHGRQLSEELLRIAEYELKDTKASQISLAREFKFNHKLAPSPLVVPIEACLIPSMPNAQDPWPDRNFRAFPVEPVTIAAFLDEANVLPSLQKPRKLKIRGSDGKIYAVLAKPKDDLRKDQRLMEFNTMINRFLKRDVEASKRRLYIRTYAVVPLNEECGLIEWVNNLKTLREILLRLYKERGVVPNYGHIRALLDEGCNLPAEKAGELFKHKTLSLFPPIFHDWFVEEFPDSSAWVAARLRYTRSCAVMSIVGHVLGLGDRHGENILFEEDNGGTFHVDFNCLFDKGLTFEKPELVPFRLTHNMTDAFGVYGYDGPFRRCCEITLSLLRSNEDALMTILETFLYDPTTDFMGGKRKRTHPNVPDTPQGVLEGIRGKTRGILEGESIPLSVGGYVQEMIQRATDPNRLVRMYIGWCAFL